MNKNNRNRDHSNDELLLDQFIDDLSREKKPAAYLSGPVDPEMEKMFETIRAVRRLKKGSGQRKKTISNRPWKGFAALAAALLLLLLGARILPLPWVDNGLLSRWSGVRQAGIVEAAVKAYEELHSYSGVFEIRNERNGEVQSLESVTIRYQKPNRYAAVHRSRGYETRYISDGEKMMAEEHAGVTVDYLFPEKELWRYHIGTVIRELAAAEKVEVTGREQLFGRAVDLLTYRYPGSGSGEYSEVWIDSATYLPLRKVLYHPDGSTVVVEFRELVVNAPVDAAEFAWTLPQGKEVVELNRLVDLEQVKNAWPEVETILPVLYPQMNLVKTGALHDDLFEYVLRFQGEGEHDYLDIYYTAAPREFYFERQNKVGLLGGGYVELSDGAWNVFKRYFRAARTARWVAGEWEIFLVTGRGADLLQSLLEQLAQEKIAFKTVQEMKTLGFEPVTEKEGH